MLKWQVRQRKKENRLGYKLGIKKLYPKVKKIISQIKTFIRMWKTFFPKFKKLVSRFVTIILQNYKLISWYWKTYIQILKNLHLDYEKRDFNKPKRARIHAPFFEFWVWMIYFTWPSCPLLVGIKEEHVH
jgi:hypothetical protein